MNRDISERKSWIWILVLTVGTTILMRPAMAQNEPEPEATLASQLREALSLDPITLAALEIDPEDAYDLALIAIEDAGRRKEVLEPLVRRCQAAFASCASIVEEQDYNNALTETQLALAELIANKGDWFTDGDSMFDGAKQAALNNASANIVLDSPLRLLDLDEQQRLSLWHAQAERNYWLLNPATCRRGLWVSQAWEKYWRVVEETLSPNQYAELGTYYQAVEEHLSGILASESEAFEHSRHVAAPRWRPFLAMISPHVRDWIPRIIATLRQVLPRKTIFYNRQSRPRSASVDSDLRSYEASQLTDPISQ